MELMKYCRSSRAEADKFSRNLHNLLIRVHFITVVTTTVKPTVLSLQQFYSVDII
jgi:hypothetical protein